MKKLFAMLLVLLVCAAALPLQALAVEVPQYVASIGVSQDKDGPGDCKSELSGHIIIDRDLNDGAGGDYVYMGYKTTTDPSQAITGIIVRVGGNPPHSIDYNGCTFYLVGGDYEPNTAQLGGWIDLNARAGGDYLYTYVTRDPSFGDPLISINVTSVIDHISPFTYVNNTNGNPQHLNSGGAGGYAIYLEYLQFEDIYEISGDSVSNTVYLSYRYLDAKGKTKVHNYQGDARHHLDQISGVPNVPKTVKLDGYTLAFNGWRDKGSGYDTTTQTPYATYMNGTTSSRPKGFYAIYSGDVTLTYDANGGSNAPAKVTKTVKGRAHVNAGENGWIQDGSSTFTLSSVTPTHSSRCKFLGWSTDKNATTAQYKPGQQVTFKSDTTLYAVWSDHTYSNTWSYDENNHWHAASCGHDLTKDVNAHTGGTATCTAKAKCSVCGAEYGAYGDHAYGELIPAQSEVHTTTELKAGVAAHYICGTCGKYFTEDKVETTPDALTGADPTHNDSAWVNTDATQHWKKCSVCGLEHTAAKADHHYADAADTTCEDCGYVRTITYTVIWQNWDGTELEKDEDVAYGATPSYDGQTPTKAGDTQTTYSFAGWEPAVSAVTGDVTYKAVFTSSTNTYTVIWQNWDGTELEKDEGVAYGATPSYDGQTPTKAGDTQTTYSFAGWEPAVSDVTGDVTYKATFTSSTNTYTVIWQNWDGTELEKDENVPYGTTPSYDGQTPTKAGDTQTTYSFAGWEPAVSAVTGDVTYKATFTSSTNTYTVIWQNWDGTELEKDEGVAYGATPSYDGQTPTKAADAQNTYVFAGWEPEITEVTGDVTYKATFTSSTNTYTVIWQNWDGTELEKDTNVSYGATPSYDGQTPTKAADAQNTYVFAGWTPEITEVTGDVTYKATFTSSTNTYTVIWQNWDGTELEKDTNVSYGATPSYDGQTPTKAGDAQNTYVFAGWTPEITDVTGDVTYKATFTSSTNTYTVIWQNWDGTELETDENVPYGATPSYDGQTPTKAGDAQTTYVFAGWTPEITEVTGDVTYKATFTSSTNTYTVIWQNWDGTELEKDEGVAYGTTPSYDDQTPTKAGDAQNTYVFAGWTPEITEVTGDVTYKAVFTSSTNTYTVIWQNWDGTELEKDTNVSYGATPSYDGQTPTKAADAQNTYVFAGWEPAVSAVTGDVIYKATFTSTAKTYIVTFDPNGGNGTMAPQEFTAGVAQNLTLNAFTREGFTFIGWNTAANGSGNSFADGASVTASGNATLYAQWQKNAAAVYTITVSNDGNGTGMAVPSSGVTGTEVELTATPNSGYRFKEWQVVTGGVTVTDNKLMIGTTNIEVKAIFELIPAATYTVTFDPNGGSGMMAPQTFTEGVAQNLTLNAFTREGFTFIGWNTMADGSGNSFADGASVTASSNATLYAQWKAVPAVTPLAITKQPTDQFVVEGQRAEFSVEATGDGLTYQWYINRNDGRGWRELDGAIGTAYVTSVTDLECDGFQYGCLIIDRYGKTLKSDVAVLHVSKVPVLPETGDSSTPMLWLAMSILSMAGILLLRKKAYSR